MVCSLAACVTPGTACANAERAASGIIASCCPTATLQPLRPFSGGMRHYRAAASVQPFSASLHGCQLQPARRRSFLTARRIPGVVATMPDPATPETEKERSPLDYPQVSCNSIHERNAFV